MALQPYQSEAYYDDTDFDVAWRGSLGYQFSDGLFLKGTYFGYKTDTDSNDDLKSQYVDLVIGQNFKPMEKLSISPFIGVRWASFEEELSYDGKFDGWGIVIGFDATRALGNNISLYVTAKQSIVFGTTSWDGYSDEDNTNASISEVGAGLQYDFCFGSVSGNVRGGVEGQYWAGLGNDDSQNTSLFGFVLGVNFRF
jgi:hypothetical protein